MCGIVTAAHGCWCGAACTEAKRGAPGSRCPVHARRQLQVCVCVSICFVRTGFGNTPPLPPVSPGRVHIPGTWELWTCIIVRHVTVHARVFCVLQLCLCMDHCVFACFVPCTHIDWLIQAGRTPGNPLWYLSSCISCQYSPFLLYIMSVFHIPTA